MRLFRFLLPYLVLETLVQVGVQIYFTVTDDPRPLFGYVSFVLTAILLFLVTWLASRRHNSTRFGVLAGMVLWIFAALFTLLMQILSHFALFGSAQKSSILEIQGYLLSVCLLTPIVILVCWAVARLAVRQGERRLSAAAKERGPV